MHLSKIAQAALNFASKVSGTRASPRAGNKVGRANEDEEFFKHDGFIFPAPTVDTRWQPIWKGSKAQKVLREFLTDIASGKKKHQKPMIVWIGWSWGSNFATVASLE